MNEMIQTMVQKVGLDETTAKQVFDFLKEHADDVPKWLASSGLADKLPGGLGGALGGLMGGDDR